MLPPQGFNPKIQVMVWAHTRSATRRKWGCCAFKIKPEAVCLTAPLAKHFGADYCIRLTEHI